MKRIRIVYNPRFAKKLNHHSLEEQKKILGKLHLFWKNPYENSLKTHRLSGKLNGLWSFSVSYHLRILFRFVQGDIVEFIDIGGHEIYK